MKYLLTLLTLIFFIGCSKVEDNMDKWKNEIMETELAFCEMAETKGIPAAFVHFAAEDAVVLRSEKLIQGKQGIADLYNHHKEKYANVKLTWKPDFIDVATSGDMAYTYGKYVFI